MYGDASGIVFNEAGVGRTEVLSSAGTRQGCSLGGFLYCLITQPILQQLADEFPDWKVLAFAGDDQILGPPKLAAQAYERWRFLYGELLQGKLNDSKSKCHSPRLSKNDIRRAGLPSGIEVSTEGTRVLGGPVGCTAFCRDFFQGDRRRVNRGFKVISRMTSLQAQHCLTTGAVQHRNSHLLRMIPGGEVVDHGDIMEAYDNALLDLPKGMVRTTRRP